MKLKLIILIIVVGLLCCCEDNNPDLISDPQTGNDSIVYIIKEKVNAFKEAQRLGQWYPASDFEGVGLYLPPGQPIEINVKNIEGDSQPKLLVGTYSRIKWSDKPTVYHLEEGNNSITDNAGGLLYLKYVTGDLPTGKAEKLPLKEENLSLSTNWEKQPMKNGCKC